MATHKLYSQLTLQEKAIRKLYGGERKFERQKYGWHWHKGHRGRWVGGHGMSAKDVAELFNITEAEVKRIKRIQVDWTRDLITKSFIDFLKKEKRWPTSTELSRKPGSLGLPCMQTIAGRFSNGNDPYASLQRRLITRSDFPPARILDIPNITVRREAIEKYGFDNLVKKRLAIKVAKDSFGILWRIPQNKDEDMFLVEVINSTPEPDGTFAHYFLRVPPSTETPQQGVAWSFGVPTDAEWENFNIVAAT